MSDIVTSWTGGRLAEKLLPLTLRYGPGTSPYACLRRPTLQTCPSHQLTDMVGPYYTLVLETEFASLADYEAAM